MANAFTPEQIAQILEEFFKTVGARQYIGARYVPIFGRKDEESIEWDNTKPYEPLTIVLYQGNSFTSRQYVPAGVQITNEEFWAVTGNYNSQIEQYRRETARALQAAQEAQESADSAQESADSAQESADNAQGDIDTLLPKREFSAENTVKSYIDNNTTRILAFDNVAAMQDATYVRAGMVCKTLGYRTPGDNGSAFYIVSSEGTANDMDVLPLQDGLFAHLVIIDNDILVEQLGAHGDGVTDDTAFVNRAFELCDVVSLSPVDYYIGGTFSLSNAQNKTLQGVYGSTSLIFNDNTTGTNSEGYVWLLNIAACENVCIKDVVLRYAPTQSTAVNKAIVNVERSNKVRFERCAFYSDKEKSGHKNICTCAWVRGGNETAYNKDITFEGCEFVNYSSANEGGCIWVVSRAENVLVDNCAISHCTSDEAVAVWSTVDGVVTLNNTSAELVKLDVTPSQLIGAYNSALVMLANCKLTSEVDLGALSFIRAHDLGKIILDSCFVKCDACANHRVFKIDVGGGEIQINNSRVEALAVNYINDGQRVFESLVAGASFKASNTVFVVGKEQNGSASPYTFLSSTAGRFQFTGCSFVLVNPANFQNMFWVLSGATYWQAVGNNFIGDSGEVGFSGLANLTDTTSVGNQRGTAITFNQTAQTAFA